MFRPLPLPDDVPGRLWLDAMPGRLAPWQAFLVEARENGLTQLVCLTPMHELTSLSPAYAEALERGLPFGWRHLAMRDFGTAFETAAFREAVDAIAEGLRAGDRTLLHCAAGIGRTGTVAACVLKRLGVPAPQALQRVRRAGSNPQSAEQSGLIAMF
jgi:protein-tyrosine phosphatase